MVFSYIINASYENYVYADKTFFEYKLKKYSVFLHIFLDIIAGLRLCVKGLTEKMRQLLPPHFCCYLLRKDLQSVH